MNPRPPLLRPAWLLAGTVLSLFAMQAAWDIALLAWVHPVLLLRFARTGRPLPALLGVLGSTTAATLVWLALADLLSPSLILLALPLALAGALPFALDRLLTPRLGEHRPWRASLVFPLATVAVEFAVSVGTPFGTVHGVLGATQASNLPLVQVASVTGVFGVSFLVAWAASAAVLLWERGLSDRAARSVAAGAVGTVVLVATVGGARLVFAPPSSDTVRIAGVTASEDAWEEVVPTFREYDSLEAIVAADPEEMRGRFAPVNDDLLAGTEREAVAGAEVVLWPESAAFTLEADKEHLVDRVRAVAEEHGVYVNAGMSVYTEDAPHLRNQMVMVTPEGDVAWTYDKSRPIPVLEPYEAGDGVIPVADTPAGRLATAICYDGDFPALVRQAGAADADVLLVGANTWEGIKEMHARNAVFRAVENGASLFRQASRGRSNATDHQGRTLATTDYFTTGQQTMVAYVPREGVTTLYSRIGDAFAWSCLAALLALAATGRRRHGGRRGPSEAPEDGARDGRGAAPRGTGRSR
ncbi:nitrilase [Streptomonospora nanhaiensis]|uniref:Nitrilase n=1 Tax=Streptomonospora nanhaiensis TaxID=1323731 RepID=A0ABY6YR61_9ACTN|nr:nitrilase-related carbon-nitrogen hydrolase [Streptomonospora nanhaiensis]WAE74733.1 nitrilase [Streptomonospora nanhaiensis]